MSWPVVLLLLAGAGIEAAWLHLAWAGNWAARFPEVLPVLLGSSLFYILSIWILHRYAGGRSTRRLILGFAFLFRITAAFVPPSLSDDLLRYAWEGRMQVQGRNPYEALPDDPRIPSAHLPAGYGPLWLLLERGVAHVGTTPTLFRLLAWSADLSLLFILSKLLAQRSAAPEMIAVYAWCPLPLIEFWVHGHNDSFVVLALALALVYERQAGWLALAAGSLVKLWPVLLAPLFRAQRAVLQVSIAAGATLALAALYWTSFIEKARMMSGFLGAWRNNESLFPVLAWAAGSGLRARWLALALLALLMFLLVRSRRRVEWRMQWWIAALLALSANVHPWYLTWLLPGAVLMPRPVWLLAFSLAPLLYRPVIEYHWLGIWQGSPPERWLFYLPVFALAAREVRRYDHSAQP